MDSKYFLNHKFMQHELTGGIIRDCHFIGCDFSRTDLTETTFHNCTFYHPESESGCIFLYATLRDARFIGCDLSMCNFRFANTANALGIEIRACRAQGADFRDTSFMNKITDRTWFCSAFITKSNLSYANFSKVILEKCELWENRWTGAIMLGASFIGSDLSGGEFNSFDWRAANFTHCDLTGSALGNLNIRNTELDGVKIDTLQVGILLSELGLIVSD